MAIDGLGGSSLSWAQFVTATQAARQRNSALTLNATGNSTAKANNVASASSAAPKANPVISPKTAHNVYSTYGNINKPVQPKAEPQRPVGSIFDAYA